MSLDERLTWDFALDPPEVRASTLAELLQDLNLEDSPKVVQARVLTALATHLPLGIALEAHELGLVPPPELPQIT